MITLVNYHPRYNYILHFNDRRLQIGWNGKRLLFFPPITKLVNGIAGIGAITVGSHSAIFTLP